MIPLPLINLLLAGLLIYQQFESVLIVFICMPFLFFLQGVILMAVKRFQSRPLSRFLNEVGDNLCWKDKEFPSVRGAAHLDEYNQKLRVMTGPEGLYVYALFFCRVVLPWEKIRSLKVIHGGEYAVVEMKESPTKKLVLPWSLDFNVPSTVWKL